MRASALVEVVRQDPRFTYEAYEFLFDALKHTQHTLGILSEVEEGKSERHVTGQQLVRGMCDLARHDFGMMARTVFQQWGINSTADIGEMVFNLIEAELMSKTPEDTLADFKNVCDLDKELAGPYEIKLDDFDE